MNNLPKKINITWNFIRPKKISAKWVYIVMIAAAISWAFVIRFIASKLANPDSLISVITVIILVFIIGFYLLNSDIKNSVELKDDDQAN